MVVLDRFSGGSDPEGWILRAEQYFTCLGFSQKHWLPLPYFYLDGEALAWFTWLHRNKQFFDWKHLTEKMLMRFPQHTFTASVSMADTSRACIDYMRYGTIVRPVTSASAVVALSHVTNSSDLEDAFTIGNTEAHHMLEKWPEKYTKVDSLALLTGSNTEIATLEGQETSQIGNAKSIEADLVLEPSSLIEGQVFDEISHTTVSSGIPELHYNFCDDISMQTKVLTSVLNDPKGSNDMEEQSSLDTVALFEKSSKKVASGSLAHFAKQAIRVVFPIATQVSLIVPLVGREVMMLNEYLAQDIPMRYVVTNFFGSGSPKWKPDLETFTVGMEDLFLAKSLLENGNVISTSVMHSIGLLLRAEKRKSMGGFNADPCVWDPEIGFEFMALTSYIENTEELLLLECTEKFFLIAYLNPLRRVWDPGKSGRVNSYWFNFSVVDNCNAFTYPSIAYSLVFAAYYSVKHDVLVANFHQTSALHLFYINALVGMVQVWEVKVLRSVYKVMVVHSVGYTLYGVIEIVESAARYRLHHGLGIALVFINLLNKSVVARQAITELNLIFPKSFTINQKEHGHNWLLSVLVERFGGRRAFTTIAQYLEVNNFCFDESEHVMKYYLYHILSNFGPPFDPNCRLGEILSIPLCDTTTYILVSHGNTSFDRKEIAAKEEWNEKGTAAPSSHLYELLLLENMTKVPYVASNSASTSLDDIIRCIALLDTSHISTHLCHIDQQLSKNEATMSIILQAATQIASLLLTNLTVPGDAHVYSNLEDKVLIEVGGIVMNGPRPIVTKQSNIILMGRDQL